MTIRNIGSKIINIGTAVLLPDSEMEVSEAVASAPAIQTFVRMNLIRIDGATATKTGRKKAEEKEAALKAAAEAAAKAEAEKKAAEEAARKKAEEEAKKKAGKEVPAEK